VLLYRVLELSDTFEPTLSAFRRGVVRALADGASALP
jgi:hypothetical protein